MVDRNSGVEMFKKHAHCHFCGASLARAKPYDGGLQCYRCKNTNYLNSIPVAVLIIPCSPFSVMAVRRNIEPFRGKLSLPGGFVLEGESWQQAGVREVGEETGAVIRNNPTEWPTHFMTESTPDGTRILIFGTARAFYLGDWKPNAEVQEVMAYHPDMAEKLCFPIHQKAVEQYFHKIGAPD
jgi:ADP-ribose pyrophosphatase YjhB (NUDIX family)